MAAGRRIDPENLLRIHFSREIEEERNRPASRDPFARTEGEPAKAYRRNVPLPSAAPRLPGWFNEAAAAAVLAACVGASFLAAPGGGVPADPEVLGARAVIAGRSIGTRLARAASEFAELRGPASKAPVLPGRFRGKE